MEYIIYVGLILFAYLIGAIPFGFIIVKLSTGKDVRNIQSGRTGGTNAMRAGGFFTGLLTAFLDTMKGVFVVWAARQFFPLDNLWLFVLIPTATIIGHNNSIYLRTRGLDGKYRLSGGAGGAVCLGGSIGLWWPSGLIIVSLCALIFYFVGHASVTTLSIALLSILIFSIRAVIGSSSWAYVLYAVLGVILLVWSLRPNILRLREGTERLHGYRARLLKTRTENNQQ